MRVRSRSRGLSRLLVLQFGGFRGTSLIFIITGLALFSVSATNPTTLQGARIFATDALAPLIAAINKPAQVASDYISTVSGIGQLQEEVTALRQENARLREWHEAALSLKAETPGLLIF